MARGAAMAALLLAIVAGFYWKLTLTRQFDWVSGPDLVDQVLPWFQVQAVEWHQRHVPLWDPYLWNGQPLLGQAQPGGAYPLNWALFLLPLSHGKIGMYSLQWYFVAIHWMAAMFCYWLCRDLGHSRLASVLGGCVFSFSAYLGTASWPQMINGAVWAPLVFLFELRAIEGKSPVRNAILSGTFLGVSWLSGHHQAPLLLTLAWGGVWVYHGARAGRGWAAHLRLAALGLVFMLLTGALQILPAYEYGRLAVRWVGADSALGWDQVVPYAIHARYSLKPSSLFSIVFPALSRNSDPYVGVAAFTLALAAIGLRWRERWVPLFGTLALASIVFALGEHSVFHGLLYGLIPMVEKARVPSAAVFLFGLSIAVLASFAADGMPALSSPWPRRATISALVFGGATAAIVFGVYAAHGLAVTFDDRVMVTAFAALLVAGLLHAWNRGAITRTQGATLALLLVLFELGNNAGYVLADRSDTGKTQWMDRLQSNGDIARFLASRPRPFRIECDDASLPLDWAEWNGFATVRATTASVTTNIVEREFSSWQFRALSGVRYRIARTAVLADERDIFTGASGLKVFEQPQAFPRAWAVHRVLRATAGDTPNAVISQHLSDLRAEALTTGDAPALSDCPVSGEETTLEELSGGSVRVRARLNCGAMIVVSDTWYPGWEARVDGRRAPIYEADGCFQGIAAPKGSHEILLRYRPASVEAGAALSLAGVLGAAAAGLLPLTYARKAGTILGKNVS